MGNMKKNSENHGVREFSSDFDSRSRGTYEHPDEEIMPCECRLDKPASEFRELICFNTFFAFFYLSLHKISL